MTVKRVAIDPAVRLALPLALVAFAGCRGSDARLPDGGNDTLGDRVHGELSWRVRCDADGAACRAYADRTVSGFDREGTLELQCSVVETATTRSLTFTALVTSSTGVTVMNAIVPRTGGAPDPGSCGAGVFDEGEIWLGACGGEPPSDTQPCQLAVVFTRDGSVPVVAGELLCAGMTPWGATMPQRGLTGPGDAVGASMTPVTFSFRNCAGYVPD